jgi:hypothetical protein
MAASTTTYGTVIPQKTAIQLMGSGIGRRKS